jgi:hypothetical protein|tara:strand:+ start:2335 stop:2529 length:195 start_codon:yes stop_codon:yes gene_type:complete
MIGNKLSILHDMWEKGVIEPSHIISYLDKLDHTLGFITLSEISVISKDKKSKHKWTKEKNNTQI